MLLPSLREEVLHANREIARRGLAPHTFGNVSGIDRTSDQPLVVIKPSGVDYATMTAADLAQVLGLPLPQVQARLKRLKKSGSVSFNQYHDQTFYRSQLKG